MSVAVIGAGIAGLYTTSLIRNHDVRIFELKSKIGLVEKCTGLISLETLKRIEVPKDMIDGIYRRILLITGRRAIEFYNNRPIAVRITRARHEEYLSKQIIDKGHKILTKTQALSVSSNGILTIKRNGVIRKEKYQYIIIASGWNPNLPRITGLHHVKEVLYGIQMFAKPKAHSLYDTIIVLHGFLPDGWAWIVPTIKGYLVGVASKNKPLTILSMLISKLQRKNIIEKIISKPFGGVIVRGYPIKLVRERIVGIGDAVSMTKSFTCGGLYPISIAGKILARAIDKDNLIIYEREIAKLKNTIKSQYIATKTLLQGNKIILRTIATILSSKRVKITAYDYDNHFTALLKALH